MKVAGLVVGTRKAATTWVYANLQEDSRFCISRKVKESGFFAGTANLNFSEYCDLYSSEIGRYCVEVDASVCYAKDCVNRINRYAPDANVILILRNPTDYLVSRYIHSKRKGELGAKTIAEAIAESTWLRDELDYPEIVSRLTQLGEGRLLLLRYESLRLNKLAFMRKIITHLTGGKETIDSVLVSEKQNTARRSILPGVSRCLSSAARLARNYQLHGLVNVVKKLGAQKLIERKMEAESHEFLRGQAEWIVNKEFKKSIDTWENVKQL